MKPKINLTMEEYEHDANKKMKHVIWTCFAGRKNNLKIMLRYVLALIERGFVNECHLWNFTRNEEDDRWLRQHFKEKKLNLSGDTLQSSNQTHPLEDPIRLINVRNKRSWSEYYMHYTKERYQDHIIIKCDDDIVFIDVEQFGKFIENRIRSPDTLLAFPSIINNALCSNFQQDAGFLDVEKSGLGCFPFNSRQGRLWKDGILAENLHDHFIDCLEEYRKKSSKLSTRMVKKGVRVSINLFAIMSKDLDVFKNMGSDDEHDLTVFKTAKLNRQNHVDLSCFVAHLAFAKQRATGMNEKRILERYANIADDMDLPKIV